MIIKSDCEQPDKVRVRFELPSSLWVDTVYLAGDFNDWNRTSPPLTRHRDDGTWSITLDLPRGGEYQFRYCTGGGDWHNDSNADKYVPNIYGGHNSVVVT